MKTAGCNKGPQPQRLPGINMIINGILGAGIITGLLLVTARATGTPGQLVCTCALGFGIMCLSGSALIKRSKK